MSSRSHHPARPARTTRRAPGLVGVVVAVLVAAGLAGPAAATLADADGDGVQDAEDSCPQTPGDPLRHGCPAPREQFPTDFDGDGRSDVFWANPADNTWRISYGGHTDWQITATANAPYAQLSFGDFNGDGRTDVFWVRPTDNVWNVSYSGTSNWTRLNAGGVPNEQLLLGDLNGDGRTDVLWANPADGRWWVSYSGANSWVTVNAAGVSYRQLKLGDFDGDGRADVFWANPSDGVWRVSYGGTSAWQVINSPGVSYAQVLLGDFDADGRSDVFRVDPADGSWWVSSAGTGPWQRINAAGLPIEQLQLGDFDADGRTDVFRANPATGAWQVSYAGLSAWQTVATSGTAPEQLRLGGGQTTRLVRSTSAPTVSGSPTLGSTLAATPGGWTPAQVTTSYQWLLDGAAIGGATGGNYSPASGDVGRTLSVRVIATRPGYRTASADSAGVVVQATAVPPTTPPGVAASCAPTKKRARARGKLAIRCEGLAPGTRVKVRFTPLKSTRKARTKTAQLTGATGRVRLTRIRAGTYRLVIRASGRTLGKAKLKVRRPR